MHRLTSPVSASWVLSVSVMCCACGGLDADGAATLTQADDLRGRETSDALQFAAPAGHLPTSRNVLIDGQSGAVLPNGPHEHAPELDR
jgi:hypothetical protein